MKVNYYCGTCSSVYDPVELVWRCTCGGLLNLQTAVSGLPMEKVEKRPASMWRYKEVLPFEENADVWKTLTMGEGYTPIVPLDSESGNIYLKLDYVMPTLSFKDRGAVVLVAKAKELGVKKLIADSSGNAGTSIAAYGNRASIECHIYVPESTSAKKLKQMKKHGAVVHLIAGNREDTAEAAKRAVERDGAFYASHVYNPFFYQGTKTYVYEMWEQLEGKLPDVLVVPVGNGTLLLGVYYGLQELFAMGLVGELPQILAVQAEGCAPLAAAFAKREDAAVAVKNYGTAAEGIAIADPPRSRQILAAVRETSGVMVTASESEIGNAQEFLANRGFYVEPTTAAAFAGFTAYARDCLEGDLPANQEPLFTEDPFQPDSSIKVVFPLCGAGLKAD